MRTLNRPMFRYGGPIKEGVMNGIREPKRNGGSMANNEGPRRAALVGNPIYPKGPDGRTNHVMPAIVGAALRFLPSVYRGIRGSKFVRGFKPTGNFRTVAGKDPAPAFVKGDPTAFPGSASSKMGVLQALKDPTRLGSAIRENPGTATSIASLLGYGGKELLSGEPKKEPGKPSLINQRKAKIGMPENLTIVKGGQFEEPAKELTEAERIELENKARREKMENYRKIMDIKGMSKNAAYKSLVDASKIIQEGGNLKEQLKDGSLITKITAAASKRFDKVSDTENALRSLVAKGEIDNEMNKETKALDKKYKEGVIAMNQKKMSGPTLQELLSDHRNKKGKNATGTTLAGYVIDKGGEVVDIVDSSLVDKHIKGGGDTVSFMELIVAKNLEKGTEVTPGLYVVKDSLITVNEDGSVTPNYKIS